MNWPELIKQARLSLGENQTQFAKRFNVATNTVSRWETGAYEISLAAVEWLIANKFMREIRICPRCGGRGIVNEDKELVKS